MLLSQFLSNLKRCAPFHRIAYDYSRAEWKVLVIIWDIFHGRISINSVLLVNFVSVFSLEWTYISLIKNIRLSPTYLHGFLLLVLQSWFVEITFSVCTNKINLLNLTCIYANNTKECITSQKPGSWDFWRISNGVIDKSKSTMPPLFNSPGLFSFVSNKATLFTKNICKNFS